MVFMTFICCLTLTSFSWFNGFWLIFFVYWNSRHIIFGMGVVDSHILSMVTWPWPHFHSPVGFFLLAVCSCLFISDMCRWWLYLVESSFMIHIVICRLALTPFLWSINFYLLHFTLQLYVPHSGVTVCVQGEAFVTFCPFSFDLDLILIV